MPFTVTLQSGVKNSDESLLKLLWDFVMHRIKDSEFESFVYENSSRLESLFSKDTVQLLVELDYKSANLSDLRVDLRKALSEIPLSCECIKISDSVEMDIGFSPKIGDSAALIKYVDEVVIKPFQLIECVDAFSGYWQSVKGGVKGVKEYFQEGNFYSCNECRSAWLIVLNESNVSYLFQRLNKSDLDSIKTKKFPWLNQLWLGYLKCK